MNNELRDTDIRVIDRSTLSLEVDGNGHDELYGWAGNELFRHTASIFMDEDGARNSIRYCQSDENRTPGSSQVFGIGPRLVRVNIYTGEFSVSRVLAGIYKPVRFGPFLEEDRNG